VAPSTTRAAVKLYAAKGDTIKKVNADAQQATTTSPAWALPVIGTLALLGLVVGGARALTAKRHAKVDPRSKYTPLASRNLAIEAGLERTMYDMLPEQE